MAEASKTFKVANLMALLVCGISLGWLMGLSISDNVKGILTTIIVLLVSIVSALSGIKTENINSSEGKKYPAISPIPLSITVLGLAIGATFGIYARAHNVLGGSNNKNTNLSSEEKKARLPILYTFPSNFCDQIRVEEGNNLRFLLKSSTDTKFRAMVDSSDDKRILELRDSICNGK